MTKQELQQGENTKKRILAGHPTMRRLLISVLVLIVVGASVFLAWYMRPIARVNRKLAGFGCPPIPASRTEFNIRIGKPTYIRFSTDPDTITQYISQVSDVGTTFSGVLPNMKDIKGKCPSWFRPPVSPNGHGFWIASPAKNRIFVTYVFHAVEDGQHAVYIVLPSKEGGLDRILNWLRSIL